MTQLSPSTVISDQASVAIQKLLDAYKAGAIQDLDEISVKLRDVVSNFVEEAGAPIASYDPLVAGEPPLSAKTNRWLSDLQHDINIMQRQSEFIKASSVYLFNIMATEVQLAKNEQNKLRNKLKTLELYSGDTDPTIATFSEHFASDDYLDPEAISGSAAAILEDSYLTLGREGDIVNLAEKATVEILGDSNGFLGNNLETAYKVAAADADPYVNMFLAEKVQMDKLKSVTDAVPNTWIEYSAYRVAEADRQKAKNFNFSYEDPQTGSKIDWSKGPRNSSDKLTLALEFELENLSRVNYISLSPFGGMDNSNHPITVKKVQTSSDGTNWTVVDPKDLWITTNQNISSLRASDNLSIGTTVWSFMMREVKFVRMLIEQTKSVDCSIGHVYYIDTKTNERIEGPSPTLNEPRKFYSVGNITTRNMTQKREMFNGKRWFIGLRDIGIQQVQYAAESSMISKRIHVPGGIDRVALDADTYIPADFGSDNDWIEFYVSGDDGDNWNRISRVRDDFLGIPEVIAFNDPTPEAFQEPGVLYVTTEKPVESVRVKIVMRRPAETAWATPLVRSYSLRIKKK